MKGLKLSMFSSVVEVMICLAVWWETVVVVTEAFNVVLAGCLPGMPDQFSQSYASWARTSAAASQTFSLAAKLIKAYF